MSELADRDNPPLPGPAPDGPASQLARGLDIPAVRQLLQAMPGVFFVYDLVERRATYASRDFARFLGYSGAEVSLPHAADGDVFRLLHPHDRGRLPDMFARFDALPDGAIAEMETRWRHAGGQWRWLYLRVAVGRRDSAGRVRDVVGVTIDVTGRKAAERQAAAYAELGLRLSSAATAHEAGIVIADVADELLGWDAYSLDLYDAANGRVFPVLTIDTVDGTRVPTAHAYADREPSPTSRRVVEEGPLLILRTAEELAAKAPPMAPAPSAFGVGLVPFGDTSRPSASLMFVPVRYGGAVIGILSVQSYISNAFTPEDRDALLALADHCGGALERIRAREELQQIELRRRAFVREVLFSATEGKLRLCDDVSELPPPCALERGAVELTSAALSRLRQVIRAAGEECGLSRGRIFDLLIASGEAAMNAITHAGGGIARVTSAEPGASPPVIQVRVEDDGGGIAFDMIHRAAMEPGYTTAGTLGQGFPMMLRLADRVWLYTGARGTTVIVEQDGGVAQTGLEG